MANIKNPHCIQPDRMRFTHFSLNRPQFALQSHSGEYKGSLGSLLSIDGYEGVVHLDGRSEIIMVNMQGMIN
jgi:hypothetical protein